MGLEPTASSATNFRVRLFGFFRVFGLNYSGCYFNYSIKTRFAQAATCSFDSRADPIL